MKTILLALGLVSLSACNWSQQHEVRHVIGTVKYNTVEGGFFYIRGDDSVSYDPTNFDGFCMGDGVRVDTDLKIRNDLGNTHMFGTIVDIVSLKTLTVVGPCSVSGH